MLLSLFNPYVNLPSQSSHQLLLLLYYYYYYYCCFVVVVVVVVIVLLLTIIYTINLFVVRPRSCRVIYYFDTPALGRRHQSFDRVTHVLPFQRHKFLLNQNFITPDIIKNLRQNWVLFYSENL
jgi:hypothetical protein